VVEVDRLVGWDGDVGVGGRRGLLTAQLAGQHAICGSTAIPVPDTVRLDTLWHTGPFDRARRGRPWPQPPSAPHNDLYSSREVFA
jgi:hypothetical protein